MSDYWGYLPYDCHREGGAYNPRASGYFVPRENFDFNPLADACSNTLGNAYYNPQGNAYYYSPANNGYSPLANACYSPPASGYYHPPANGYYHPPANGYYNAGVHNYTSASSRGYFNYDPEAWKAHFEYQANATPNNTQLPGSRNEPKKYRGPHMHTKGIAHAGNGAPSNAAPGPNGTSGPSTLKTTARSLERPKMWDPACETLPFEEITSETAECRELGLYTNRPDLPTSKNPLLGGNKFSMYIRYEGNFDKTGRQPGLFIRAERFVLHILARGHVGGERKVEIWRGGQTIGFFGLIGLWTDDHEWQLGYTQLNTTFDNTYVGWEAIQPVLAKKREDQKRRGEAEKREDQERREIEKQMAMARQRMVEAAKRDVEIMIMEKRREEVDKVVKKPLTPIEEAQEQESEEAGAREAQERGDELTKRMKEALIRIEENERLEAWELQNQAVQERKVAGDKINEEFRKRKEEKEKQDEETRLRKLVGQWLRSDELQQRADDRFVNVP